jgi:hypothetical protein
VFTKVNLAANSTVAHALSNRLRLWLRFRRDSE